MVKKLLQNRVLIEEQDGFTEKTEGGIFIPDTAKEKLPQGKVVAIGQGINGIPMEVEIGDVVVFQKHAGTEITLQGKKYLIMRETDIQAVL